jgi:hypothetical protein
MWEGADDHRALHRTGTEPFAWLRHVALLLRPPARLSMGAWPRGNGARCPHRSPGGHHPWHTPRPLTGRGAERVLAIPLPLMDHALPTLLGTSGTLPAVAAAHDAFVGPDHAFLQHGLDGPVEGLQALIDVRGRLHTRAHATFMISRQPWLGARPCDRPCCASQLCLSADRGLIQAPADVHRSRQAMPRRLTLRRVLQDPPVHRRLVDGDTPLLPQRFERPRAQRIRHLSADTREEDICCGVRLLVADHHRPLSQALRAGGGSSPTRWRTTRGDSAAASPSRGRHR